MYTLRVLKDSPGYQRAVAIAEDLGIDFEWDGAVAPNGALVTESSDLAEAWATSDWRDGAGFFVQDSDGYIVGEKTESDVMSAVRPT